MTPDLRDYIAGLPLVDNHVHGFWTSPTTRRTFEHGLNEANTDPLADFDSGFDTQPGFAVRAHCSPLLGLPRHAEPDEYWARRNHYRPTELASTFLSAAGVSDWLVDTGTGGVAGLDEVHSAARNPVHEIVRLEQVAEQAVAAGGDYADTFRDMLETRAAVAVATKTVVAYRGGLDQNLAAPAANQVAAAAARWRGEGGRRLSDPVLLSFGIQQALLLGKPLQFHVGLGDRDCDLHRTNPILLLDFLRSSGDTPIVLLHCYPYEREAGYLARAFNHVYVDTGLSVNHLGARAADFLARSLELAPFRKLLYSSDGFGPPELHYLGARLWRDGMAAVLQGFVDRGEWSTGDAARLATLIGRDNARRLYGL